MVRGCDKRLGKNKQQKKSCFEYIISCFFFHTQ
jgi:hypothetical protein